MGALELDLQRYMAVWEGGALGKGKMPIAGGGEVAIAMSVEKGCPIIVGVTQLSSILL